MRNSSAVNEPNRSKTGATSSWGSVSSSDTRFLLVPPLSIKNGEKAKTASSSKTKKDFGNSTVQST